MSRSIGKRDRSDDLPAFSGRVWRLRHELATARAGWAEKVNQIGLVGSPGETAAQAFEAYAAARQRWHRWRLDRPGKLAQIRAARPVLDALIELHDEWRSISAELPSVEDARSIVGLRERSRFIRNEIWPDVINQALRSDRARLDEFAATLDGRGHSATRLRVFAEELLPIFNDIVPAERQSRSSFRAFLGACCELVSGKPPGAEVLKRVAREVHK